MLLELDGISFSYGEKRVLSNISFTLDHSQILLIAGENGSGKSTLLKLISTLLVPSNGMLRLSGIPYNEDNYKEIRKRISYIFQKSDDNFCTATVRDEIAFKMQNASLCEKRVQEKTDQILRMSGLYDKRYENPLYLSSGEKERLMLYSSCTMDEDLLVFDESFSNMDERGRKEAFSFIKEMKDRGKGIIYVSHSSAEMDASDRILILKDGNLLSLNESRNVLSNHEELYKSGLDIRVRDRSEYLMRMEGFDFYEIKKIMEGI